jgi:N-acetyltransferase
MDFMEEMMLMRTMPKLPTKATYSRKTPNGAWKARGNRFVGAAEGSSTTGISSSSSSYAKSSAEGTVRRKRRIESYPLIFSSDRSSSPFLAGGGGSGGRVGANDDDDDDDKDNNATVNTRNAICSATPPPSSPIPLSAMPLAAEEEADQEEREDASEMSMPDPGRPLPLPPVKKRKLRVGGRGVMVVIERPPNRQQEPDARAREPLKEIMTDACASPSATGRSPHLPPTTSALPLTPLPSSSSSLPAPAPAPAEKGKKTRKRRLTQLQLDLSTAATSIKTTCQRCGMDYIPSNMEDAALHKLFHARNARGGISVGTVLTKNSRPGRIWPVDSADSSSPSPEQQEKKNSAGSKRGGKKRKRSGEGGGGGGDDVDEVAYRSSSKRSRASHAPEVIVIVDRRSSAAEKAKAKLVLDTVNAELSAADIDDATLWSQISLPGARDTAAAKSKKKLASSSSSSSSSKENGAKNSKGVVSRDDNNNNNNNKADRFRVYMHLKGSTCIGLCLAERISHSYDVVLEQTAAPPHTPAAGAADAAAVAARASSGSPPSPTSSYGTIASSPPPLDLPRPAPPPPLPLPRSSSITIGNVPRPAILGISRVWTSRAHRRQHVATRLLECVQRTFIYGVTVPKQAMAFSQPSESGKYLAERWFAPASNPTATMPWKVYVEH